MKTNRWLSHPGATLAAILTATLLAGCASPEAARPGASRDPLPSWNRGPAREAIVDFVRATTDRTSPKFVPPEERIAVFDNDGTLWVEQPAYAQLSFALDRMRAMAPEHPEWKDHEPFATVLKGDRAALAEFTVQDIVKIVAATHSGMTVEEFHDLAKQWLATAQHPRFKRPYTELVYQPMLEVMRYLRANGFKTYIVTGGGQEFVRACAEGVYGVPPEQVIGSAGLVKYGYGKDGQPELVKLPKALLIDDKAGKPECINLIIGRRPIAAFGNSTGDQQMLEYTQTGAGARLLMLIRHDDAAREYAYGPDSNIGTFSDDLATEARHRGWTVVSMKDDWKVVFPPEKP
jgi:hypothetical protein